MIRAVAAQMTGAMLCAAVSFALMLYLARALGVASFGAFLATLSFAVVALPVIECGWSQQLYRSSVDDARNGAKSGIRMHFALGHALAVTVTLVVAAWLGWRLGVIDSPALPCALACMGLVALGNFVSARMRGEGRFALESAWQVCGRIGSAVAVVATIAVLGPDVALVFVAWCMGLLLVAAIGAIPWLTWPRWDGLASTYRIALPLAAVEVTCAMLFKGDVALVSATGMDGTALSHYAACARVGELVLLMAAPLCNVGFRRLRELHSERDDFARELRRLSLAVSAAGAIVALVTIPLGSPLMSLLFGVQFESAGHLLPWVAAALPLALPNLMLVQALVARGSERGLALALAGSVALGAVLLVALAWRYGARGAALACCAAQATALLAMTRALRCAPRCA